MSSELTGDHQYATPKYKTYIEVWDYGGAKYWLHVVRAEGKEDKISSIRNYEQ